MKQFHLARRPGEGTSNPHPSPSPYARGANVSKPIRLPYKVRVYDQSTDTMRDAVVVRRYNRWSEDLIDVRFIGEDRVSEGHLANMVSIPNPAARPEGSES